MPKISVIIPVYNTEKYLSQCLDSVLAQTFDDFEVICVNDGSTDGSLAILEEYAQKDKRVKIINHKNSGAGYSRNAGVDAAQGDYLSFIDADDWIDVHFIETTKSYNYYSIDNIKLFNKCNAQGFIANGTFFRRDVVWDKLFKTDFIKNNKIIFLNGLCHNDAYFLLQSLYHKATVVQDFEAIYWHNKANENSIRYKPSDAKLLSQLDMFILEIEFLNSHFFTFYDYRHNYFKLLRTAKRKRKYVQSPENKKLYNEKLKIIKQLNKYPWGYSTLLFKKIFSSRFREELRNSRALPEEYPEILKKWYFKKLHKPLNLENPQTFNEKIQWLKLYDSTFKKTLLTDKYQVREYVRRAIGEEYLVPLIGVYSKFDDIDFETLPDKFVLKCNHGSGMNAIITDKTKINKKKLKAKFDEWMRENFGFVKGLQLHYNYIPHRIIAEEYIYPLIDYKFYCYNGKCIHILQKKENNQKNEYCNFDREFNCLPLSPKSTNKRISVPKYFNNMLYLAEKLATDFNFVRVDFYLNQNKVYFSELTFTPSSGVNTYTDEWDKKLGQFLTINIKDVQ
jgi:glycosyltransferase involved in cell wall biosynthesis